MNARIRQGDVILTAVHTQPLGRKLNHLTLAEGELTGHRHRICSGEAELIQASDGTLFLRVSSETATLTHEEHHAITVPKGIWQVRIQREYDPQLYNASGRDWREVQD